MTPSLNHLYLLAMLVVIAQFVFTTKFLDEGPVWEAISVFCAVICFCCLPRSWTVSFWPEPEAGHPAKEKLNSATRRTESRPSGCSLAEPRGLGVSLKESRRVSKNEDEQDGGSVRKMSSGGRTPTALKASKEDLQEPNILITAVRKGRTWELPKLLDQSYVRHLQRAGQGGDKLQVQQEVLGDLLTVLRTCSVVHQHRAALAAYDYSVSRLGDTTSNDLWSLLLYNAVEANAFNRCPEFFRRLEERFEPTNHDFVNMVRACAHFQDLAGLNQLVSNLIAKGVKYSTVTRSRALGVCSTECAFDLVVPLMDDNLFEEKLNVMNYNSILKGFARRGHLKQCLILRDQMLEKGLELTQMTFGILLDASVRAGDFVRAKAIFSDFLASGLEPNAVHYTTVIKGLVNAGRMGEVSSLIEEMDRSPTAKPDIITYQQLIKAYVDHGDLSKALQILRMVTVKGLKPDRIMCETVLQCCCSRPICATEIIGIFDMMVDGGLQPTIQTLTVLARALSLGKSWSEALAVFADAEKRFGLRPEAHLYGQLGLSCLKGDDVKTAREVYAEMVRVVRQRAVGDSVMSCLFRDCMRLSLQDAKAAAFDPLPPPPAVSRATLKTLTNCGSVKDSENGASSAEGLNRNLPSCASRRLEQFIQANNLDDRCVRLLTTVEPAKAEWTMDQEFLVDVDEHRGTASAKVVSTVYRARTVSICWASYPGPEDLEKRLVDFAQLNSLPAHLVETLRALTEERLRWVMDQDFLLLPDSLCITDRPNEEQIASMAAKVESFIATAEELPSGGAAVAALMEEYISINQLDKRCAASLRALPSSDAAWVMDQEWYVSVDSSRGTAAAKVVGLLNKLRAEHRM